MPERAVVCQHLPPPHLDILVSPEGDLLDLDIVLTLGLLGPGAGGLEELTEFVDVAGHTPGQVLGEGVVIDVIAPLKIASLISSLYLTAGGMVA